jgi:hypothetical protein
MDALQGLRAAITELQTEAHRQRDEILLLRSIKPKPKSSLPDPEKFSGQPHKFDTWLPSIKAKLRVDGEAIGDSVAQFYYVYLNLESHIQAMVLPQLHQAEESQVWNYITILDQLIRVYDNPNKVQEAEDKLLALKQGTDSIPAYVAKFERVLYEARGQNWPDVNKISTFRNGLSSTIRSRLAQQLNLPRKYPDFVRVVQQLAGRTSQAPTSGNSNGSGSGPGPGNHHYHGEPMEVGSINAIHVSSPQQRARSISPTLRGQYRLQGRCVRCGSYDHWVHSCTLQPYASGEGQTPQDTDSEGSSGTDRRKRVGT